MDNIKPGDVVAAAMDRAGELPLERRVAERRALASHPAAPAQPASDNKLLKWALRELLTSLPQRRDWLNPDAESVLREVLTAAPVQPEAAALLASGDLTDADAHKLILEMQKHVQGWADKQDLDEHDDDDHPAFSGECMRFLLRRLAFAAPPVQQPGDVRFHNVWNDALEEAALICDQQAKEPECPERAEYCADEIRALKALATTRPATLTPAQMWDIASDHLVTRDLDEGPEALVIRSENELHKVVRAILAASGGAHAVPEVKPSLRDLVSVDRTSDMGVTLRFASCRAASQFAKEIDAIIAAPTQDQGEGK